MRIDAIDEARVAYPAIGDAECGHAVQLYEDDAFLVDTVAQFIGAALQAGDGALIIATERHRNLLEERLRAAGAEIDTAYAQGRCVALDAHATLARFMVEGRPDETLFVDVVGGVIERTRGNCQHRRVRAFGEMVALLWADGLQDAAIRVEEFWNNLSRQLPFSLLCAYPIGAFQGANHDAPLLKICGAHSHVVPVETYPMTGTVGERLRAVTLLQQRASALDSAIAQRRDAENTIRARDESLRVLYEAERQARADAEAANRAKDEFLAMLGHELRNPLFAIRNAIVSARLDGSERERALDIAQRQSDYLGRLVDDMLDVARITEGRVTLQRQPVGVAGIVERAVEMTRPLVEERQHAVTVRLPAQEVQIHADVTRIEQVLVNLLSNAAKYMDPGGRIELTTEVVGNEVELRVRDHGAGISPDLLPRVFDLFVQGDRSLDRAPGGLGIGLTVARRLVELHDGHITARSDGVGKGAEFVVRLPALPSLKAGAQERSSMSPPDQGGTRVLVVEDNVDAAETLKMLLEVFGHVVSVVTDGSAAVAAARADRPRVMLVDIGLPGMDGYEVARGVRRESTLRDVVLVALTGYGRDEDKARALNAGFDYHLVKPVDPTALQALLAKLGQSAVPSQAVS